MAREPVEPKVFRGFLMGFAVELIALAVVVFIWALARWLGL